ncbi:MAG: hypothetical protein ACQEQH_04840 [Bacillota bacterium]
MDIYNYELIVKGIVNKKRFLNFNGIIIESTNDNNTKMILSVDQSSLYAVLKTVRDLKLIIISLKLLQTGGDEINE